VGAAVAPAVAGVATSFRGNLHLLLSGKGAPFADASAKLTLVGHGDASTAVLVVHGVDPAQVGRTFGAHLHNGPCVDGNGPAAGPHYNHTGQPPTAVNDQTEIWLDFTVDDDGSANAVAHVPFVATPGQRSVVIHERATAANGTAGDRLACLPVEW
jgi:Cu/Zn superoxide dismutase